MNRIFTLVTIVSAMTLAACGQQSEEGVADEAVTEAATEASAPVKIACPAADESGNIEITAGLSARIIKTGYGRAAVKGDYADTNVWLWQLDESAEDGVPCMLEGETRELVVASDLAYGASGRGAAVPPNTPLIFTIELVKLTASE